jgi:hypothetical protein
MDYAAFLDTKLPRAQRAGLDVVPPLHPALFGFQRDTLTYLLQLGRGAAFLSTGLGKTLIQLDWARIIASHTGQPVLILAPLAVTHQTAREGQRFGIDCAVVAHQSEVASGPSISVTNYDKLPHFDPSAFVGIVLDESSILKNFTGATKRALCAAFAETPFRLCCTATPAPNDYMEIGNHSEFLGVMPGPEMLSRWFIVDTMEFGTYRLKRHARRAFWRWVASWAVCVSAPSDLGYADDGFALSPLDVQRHVLATDIVRDRGETLFRLPELSATSVHREKRLTVVDRAERVATLVAAEPTEPWLIWCETNTEADALLARLPAEAIEVRGSESAAVKERKLLAFTAGEARVLVTKPSIAGFGLNWQHCARMAFVGLSFSYEQLYQAIRRCWRFGQSRPVNVHIVMAQTEVNIWDIVRAKATQHQEMQRAMCAENFRLAAEASTIKHQYRPERPLMVPAWLQRASSTRRTAPPGLCTMATAATCSADCQPAAST